MKIILLTHERELHRKTNTGALAIESASSMVERIVWERLNPNKALLRLIENNEAVLLYSKSDSSSGEPLLVAQEQLVAEVESYENIIIIDATWQESKKIYNQSPYLQKAAQCTLKTTSESLYKLRANQPKGGLCTIECIIEVLNLKGQEVVAAELSLKFDCFNA